MRNITVQFLGQKKASQRTLTFLIIYFVIGPQVTVLPPGEWDPSIRIEPPDAVPSQDKRLESAKSGGGGGGEEHDPAGDREEQLAKTGRLIQYFYCLSLC